MCTGVEWAVVGAIASAASTAVGSIASYSAQQQQAEYEYQNAIRARDYEYAVNMRSYEASQQAYNQQIEQNRLAANRGYEREQLKLKGEYDKAAQQAQVLFVQRMQAQGQALAAGRTGQSIGLMINDAQREYGRDLANLGTNLGYATTESVLGLESIFLEQKSSDLLAASQRMLEPSKGPAPVKAPVSAGSLVAGIGGGILGGIGTYSSTKAPGAKVGGKG
jgi:hypothetical protein